MKKRSILVMILLTIVTAGIYMIYWTCSFQNQLKAKTGDGFGWVGHLVMILVTVGIYYIFWQYLAGKRLAKLGANDHSILYLVLPFIGGLGVINPFIMQSQANGLK